jgi:tetratricopeptide (TPR) repeat protein
VIRVDGQVDRILGRYMAEFLEDEYPALVRQFGFEPPARTQFEVFHNGKGLQAHQWFSARLVGLPWVQTIGASTGMIVALASPTAVDQPFNWARVLKHEFIHIITLQQTEFNIPHWYTEALAVSNEGYPRPEEWNRLLLERVPAGRVMNLDDINLGFIRPTSVADWNMAYCQSRLYVEYMAEKFGLETTSRLLDAYRRNLSTEQAIERVCGVDKKTFEKGYRDYLNAVVAQLRTLRPEAPLTLAEAESAHRARPDDPRAAGRYAFEMLKINRRKEARTLAEGALERNKFDPLAAVVMAQLELHAEDLPTAARWLEPALDRRNPHPEVVDLLTAIRVKQERYEDAATLYELGLARDPDHVAWLKGLATAWLKLKRLDRAKSVLEKLAVTDADDAIVRQTLSQMALADGNFAEAVRYGKLALQIDVLDVETHRVLARAYAGLGQFDKSAGEWSVALEIEPDDPETIVELARSEVGAGRKAQAVKRVQALLDRKPDFAPARKLLGELK